ncbi:DUF2993 domain-containing protein [Haloechinothrix sp. LS1_15]|uniref:LmeA family phospholipid-binding protein n=1 Tax=Haloechinothrix sp. LS1_15 TaxID=2652248 RepID=UPI002943FFAA|nr:DUF2993 domain-containing protein [Haloechinothrix sp. LS1_15]MDV6012464.1 DUF2993 domain-containing protein [Haloechinothrix sp. LS1_15]
MKRTLVIVAILGALVVGADFAFAAVAEHRISQQARAQLELDDDPAVEIHGFPFTTQALSGSYHRISISAAGVPVSDILRDLELEAELRDIEAPLSDVLDGNTDAITIGELEGTVKVSQADLGRAIKFPTLRITDATEEYVHSGDDADDVTNGDEEPEYGSTAGIRLEATTDLAGEEDVEIVVYGVIELAGDQVRVEPKRVELDRGGGTTVIPEAVRENLLPQFATTIDPGTLPFGVIPSGVAVERGALIVQGEATDVRFADGV